MINDREFGATEAVRLEKDKLQIADMDYVVKAFLEYLTASINERVPRTLKRRSD